MGKVPDCIKSGKYTSMVDGLATAAGIHATPTVRINGQDYQWSTPDALVAKIPKEIVGDVPGLDHGCDPSGAVTVAARQRKLASRLEEFGFPVPVGSDGAC